VSKRSNEMPSSLTQNNGMQRPNHRRFRNKMAKMKKIILAWSEGRALGVRTTIYKAIKKPKYNSREEASVHSESDPSQAQQSH